MTVRKPGFVIYINGGWNKCEKGWIPLPFTGEEGAVKALDKEKSHTADTALQALS